MEELPPLIVLPYGSRLSPIGNATAERTSISCGYNHPKRLFKCLSRLSNDTSTNASIKREPNVTLRAISTIFSAAECNNCIEE